MKRLAILLTLTALAVSAAACGGDDDATDAASSASAATESDGDASSDEPACKLTAAEVSDLVGVTFGEPEAIAALGEVQCLYEVTQDGETGLLSIHHAFEDADGAEQIFTDVATDEVEVDVAEGGWWSNETENLFARQGDETVDIFFSSFLNELADYQATAVALADAAFAK
jgi:hypothetical protein